MNKKEQLEKEAQTNDLIMVQFYADWCPHCQRMKPIVDEFENKMKASIPSVIRINIDEDSVLADSYGVESIPTFILLRNGKELWRHSGEMTLEALENAAKEAEKN